MQDSRYPLLNFYQLLCDELSKETKFVINTKYSIFYEKLKTVQSTWTVPDSLKNEWSSASNFQERQNFWLKYKNELKLSFIDFMYMVNLHKQPFDILVHNKNSSLKYLITVSNNEVLVLLSDVLFEFKQPNYWCSLDKEYSRICIPTKDKTFLEVINVVIEYINICDTLMMELKNIGSKLNDRKKNC